MHYWRVIGKSPNLAGIAGSNLESCRSEALAQLDRRRKNAIRQGEARRLPLAWKKRANFLARATAAAFPGCAALTSIIWLAGCTKPLTTKRTLAGLVVEPQNWVIASLRVLFAGNRLDAAKL